MAIFAKTSRYARHAELFQTKDRRGNKVLAVLPPQIPLRRNRGTHLAKEGQRLDQLAWYYLRDAEGFWVLAAHNARILPDAVLAQHRIRIPLDES